MGDEQAIKGVVCGSSNKVCCNDDGLDSNSI